MAQQREFSITATDEWQNIGALLMAYAMPLNAQTLNFAPIIFINKGVARIKIQSNGNNNVAPVGDIGLTLEMQGDDKDTFTYAEFNSHIGWIKCTGADTCDVEIVGFLDFKLGA